MKINEIVEINDELTTIECLIIGSRCSSLSTYLTLYSYVRIKSNDFSIPSRKIYPTDSLYEFVEEIRKDLHSLKEVETRVPQFIKILKELLYYFSD